MRIYVFNSDQPMVRGVFDRGAGYCGVTACVLEGLNQLGIDVTARHEGLHVRKTGRFAAIFSLTTSLLLSLDLAFIEKMTVTAWSIQSRMAA